MPTWASTPPSRVHTMVEAKKLAFADRNRYAGDMDFVSVPLSELISKRFAASRRETIAESAGRGEVLEPIVSAPGYGNTSYFCVVDAEGNAVSFIHSLSMGFGSGFVAGNTGVLLNNRVGRGFSLVEGHPNVIEGGKRTMHTLNAYMVMRDDRPYLVGGTPGGDNQIGWNAQVITNVLDHGMSAQEAVEAPRWTSTPGTDPHSVDDPFVLELEGRDEFGGCRIAEGQGSRRGSPSGQSVRRLGEADSHRPCERSTDGRVGSEVGWARWGGVESASLRIGDGRIFVNQVDHYQMGRLKRN